MAVPTTAKRWTLAELHRLPDDGNKYELVRGELFVTPPPSDQHETVAARLTHLLAPYVAQQGLGLVFHPRSVFRYRGSEVEPDLMVRAIHPDQRGRDSDWTRAPTPTLVVEIVSPYTWRRDRNEKRRLYMEAGVPEYWIVDPVERSIAVVRPGVEDVFVRDRLTWSPAGTSDSLSVSMGEIFG